VKLEDFRSETNVRGILHDAAVTVAKVDWYGSDVLTLVHRGSIPQSARASLGFRGGHLDRRHFSLDSF
jgi:hypothetical protein